jgi:hypothetical protein
VRISTEIILVPMPTFSLRRKAASGSNRFARLCRGRRCLMTQGMFQRGWPGTQEGSPSPSHQEATPLYGSKVRATRGSTKGGTDGWRAVLRTHSTEEGGEPQGSARSGHGTRWREGGNKHTNLLKGDITGTQNPEHYVHRHRQNS